jgi:hypothetical protein
MSGSLAASTWALVTSYNKYALPAISGGAGTCAATVAHTSGKVRAAAQRTEKKVNTSTFGDNKKTGAVEPRR